MERAEKELFAYAELWEQWISNDEPRTSLTIIMRESTRWSKRSMTRCKSSWSPTRKKNG